MAKVSDIINLSVSKNLPGIQDAFNAIVKEKIVEKIESLKADVAANFFRQEVVAENADEELEMFEEVETLDEISNEKMKAYYRAASKQKDELKKQSQEARATGDKSYAYKANKYHKRAAGMQQAIQHAGKKLLTKEETLKEAAEEYNHVKDYHRGHVSGLYSHNHYDHYDGSWMQIKHGKEFKGVHRTAEGDMHTFHDRVEMKNHIQDYHDKKAKTKAAADAHADEMKKD